MRNSLYRILNLIRKEFLALLKSPLGRVILFVPAVMQSLVFGYAATYDLNDVPYAVLDQDRSSVSRDLVAMIEGNGIFRRVAELSGVAEISGVVDRREALVVVHIPQNFTRRLSAGDAVAVQVVLDGRNSNTAGIATGYIGAIIERFNAQWRREHGGPAQAPLSIETRAWYNPTLETRWHMIPSLIAALSLLQTLLLSALSVVGERESGTFDQLLVTPLRPGEIMVGKALPAVMIGLTQATLIMLIAIFWFGIPMQGSLVTLYTGLAVFTTAGVGFGLLLSAYAATMQQAMLYAFVFLMPMMLLSGLTSPVSNMPLVVQYLTMFNPLRYAIELVQRVYLEGAGLAIVVSDIVPLLLIAGVTLPTAAWLFRHRLT